MCGLTRRLSPHCVPSMERRSTVKLRNFGHTLELGPFDRASSISSWKRDEIDEAMDEIKPASAFNSASWAI